MAFDMEFIRSIHTNYMQNIVYKSTFGTLTVQNVDVMADKFNTIITDITMFPISSL
jgi:hypothetical protein